MFAHNILWDEFDAIEAFGLDPERYWQMERELRAALVAKHRLTNTMQAMMTHDAHEEAKRKAKANKRTRGRL